MLFVAVRREEKRRVKGREEGECLGDHLHCCPHGYTCDAEKEQCVREISIPWLKKKPAQSVSLSLQSVVPIESTNVVILTELNLQSEILCPDATSSFSFSLSSLSFVIVSLKVFVRRHRRVVCLPRRFGVVVR